ncbi:MAG: hypothetical protein IKW59_05680 [Clostridia bacterium]|nr:hypothetical protein [Clostridia bacterium]
MIDVIIILAGGYIAFKAYQISLIIGVLVSLLVFGVVFYRKGSAFCMAIAMRNYTKGQKIKAMNWFERGYKMGMKTEQKITYAYYLLREGRVAKCEEVLSSMLAFRSQKPLEKAQTKATHAMLLMKTGRLYEAIEELEEIFPTYKNSSTYGSLGFCYLVQGNIQKALEFNEEAYDYNSDDLIIVDNLMQTYAKMGEFEKAYELSQKLMEKEPGFREAYYDVAVIEYQMGKKEDALKRLDHALTIPTSFLTTVSDDIINSLKAKIESGEEPKGAEMVFLEVTSASLPDTPTLRVRPAASVQIMRDGAAESDDPISFTASSADENKAEMISESDESGEDDGDSIFL